MADIQIIIDNEFLKTEINKLIEEEKRRQKIWWDFSDLEDATGFSYTWLIENILYPPHFKKILTLDNGGPVYYPERNGDRWKFLASGMRSFLEDNFYEIFKNKKTVLKLSGKIK